MRENRHRANPHTHKSDINAKVATNASAIYLFKRRHSSRFFLTKNFARDTPGTVWIRSRKSMKSVQIVTIKAIWYNSERGGWRLRGED